MRRAMQVLKGMGPQESVRTYPYPYDHPYFGQLFLAAALGSQYWLYKYVFNKDFDFMSITDPPISSTNFIIPFKTQKVLFIVDSFVSKIHAEDH